MAASTGAARTAGTSLATGVALGLVVASLPLLAGPAAAQCQPTCVGDLVAVGLSNAEGPVAIAVLGNAEGHLVAVSVLGNAAASLVGLNVLGASPGNSEAGLVAVSGGGNAEASLAAASVLGNSRGLVAVSVTGHADGTVAVGGADLGLPAG